MGVKVQTKQRKVEIEVTERVTLEGELERATMGPPRWIVTGTFPTASVDDYLKQFQDAQVRITIERMD